MLIVENLLTEDEVARLVSMLEKVEFEDGRATAGPGAVGQKRNLQARGKPVEKASELVTQALGRDERVRLYALPSKILPPMFSRYEPGMAYGDHVDNAIMVGAGGMAIRTDLAMTVFLSDPDSYRGGALMVGTDGQPRELRLPRGGAVIYPAATLHRVSEVEEGVRLAAVTWLQSYVREPARRSILYELGTLARSLREDADDAERARRVNKVRANLMRMWAEP